MRGAVSRVSQFLSSLRGKCPELVGASVRLQVELTIVVYASNSELSNQSAIEVLVERAPFIGGSVTSSHIVHLSLEAPVPRRRQWWVP